MRYKTKANLSEKRALQEEIGAEFVRLLLVWNQKANRRSMPWKGEKDPYKIWLSEVILQQTRVDQGLKYYEKFINAFPDVLRLAAARDEEVFRLWQGLGYYSRCKNLIETSRRIASNFNGRFPESFEAIRALKGVGDYTAAAIVSFAYNLPYAVVDGNVYRVLSRIFEIETPIDTKEGKELFSDLAKSMLPSKKAGLYNQALMDFGATVCKPLPGCDACFFRKKCRAFLSGTQHDLPFKLKKIKLKNRWLNYIVLRYGSQVLIRQRSQKDIWQHLFEFILLETEKRIAEEAVLGWFLKQYGPVSFKRTCQHQARQKLTHQQIHFEFYELSLARKIEIPGYFWISLEETDEFAFPRTLSRYLKP